MEVLDDVSVYSIYSTFAGNSIQQPHKTYRIKASIEFLGLYFRCFLIFRCLSGLNTLSNVHSLKT